MGRFKDLRFRILGSGVGLRDLGLGMGNLGFWVACVKALGF